MRLPGSTLVEAELMNSCPEYVYGWLKRRDEASGKEAWEGDDALEEALLTRKSALIDLGLARYGRCPAVVQALFSRGAVSPNYASVGLGSSRRAGHTQNKALRLAALSNCMGKNRGSFSDRIPHILFKSPNDREGSSSPERMRKFMETAEPEELYALFKNPSIEQGILATLYERKMPFDGLTEERWQELIEASIGNPRLKESYEGPMDGWAEYEHRKVSISAFGLVNEVPATEEWASVLERLLSTTNLSEVVHSHAEIMDIILRWSKSPGEDGNGTPEHKVVSIRDEILDKRGSLRLFLAGHLNDIDKLQDSEDAAMRFAYYKFGAISIDGMRRAFAREPTSFLWYALDNEKIWHAQDSRDVLHELCWDDCRSSSGDGLLFPNIFNGRAKKCERDHPEWFASELDSRDKPDQVQRKEAERFHVIVSGLSELRTVILLQASRLLILLWIACILLAVLLLSRC